MLRWLPYLALLTVVYFLALAIFTTFWLSSAGLSPFDGQFLGYTFHAAQAYLDDLSPNQLALYLGPFRIADTIFPALVAVTLVVWFRERKIGALRLALVVLAAFYLVADYIENMLVASLLKQGADAITPYDVAVASGFTQVKWAALTVCLAVSLWLWLQFRKERIL